MTGGCFVEYRVATRVRRLGARRPAGLLALGLLTAASLAAHEGHDLVQRPVYRQVAAGGETYRVGLAAMPQDPVVGEDIRLAVHVRRLADDAPPVDLSGIRLRLVPAGGTAQALAYVGPGEQPATVSAVHRFAEDGQYTLAVEVPAASGAIRADFPLGVRPGPVVRAPFVIDGLLLIALAGAVAVRWRARAGGAVPTARLALTAAAGVTALAAGHLLLGPRVGRLFLPERHFGSIAWERPAGQGAEEAAPHTHPPGTPPHSHDDAGLERSVPQPVAGTGEVSSIVVPVPGRLAEIVVPVTARVVFDDFVPRPGRAVRRGQKIAMLEHHYILHDAVHLVNQRWPYLLDVFEKKRDRLAADLNVVRQRHLQATGDPAVREMMTVTQAVSTAESAAAEAALRQARADKLLAMHDTQIAKRDLVRRPVEAPIGGIIDAVHFTQGELKYESDPLLRILDLSEVWVEARFPEAQAARPVPKTMTFASTAFPGRRFEGRLARVAKTLDPSTRTMSAFFAVGNPDRLLRLGMRLAGRGDAAGAAAAAHGVVPARLETVPAAPLALAATVKPLPELTSDVTAPLWGRIAFARRQLQVGDQVRKGEELLHVVLELSVDERYPMEARALEIASEHELAKTRRAQAEQQYDEALAQLTSRPGDRFRQQEVAALEKIRLAAQQEEILLARQAEAYQGTMKRRDPKTTIIEAPISGVITDINFTPGELNRTGEFRRLLTVVDTSRVLLEAPLYPHQIPAAAGSRGATLVPAGLTGARRLGPPIAISGALDADSGALRVLFDAPNADGALKVGASARILIPRN